jgi:hypothetical protein
MPFTGDPDGRAERAAMNQLLFRDINERMKNLESGFSVLVPVGAWICECANDACAERVQMSAEEYEAIRSSGTRFLVAPSNEHVWPDVERVVESTDHYWVVEKTGDAGELAERLDPRVGQGPLLLQT